MTEIQKNSIEQLWENIKELPHELIQWLHRNISSHPAITGTAQPLTGGNDGDNDADDGTGTSGDAPGGGV